MHYIFDWDPRKESTNIRKHEVSFRLATTIFRDKNQLSLFDIEHSDQDDRWITLGIDQNGTLRVVVHTFEHLSESSCRIRIISARKATENETDQYNSGDVL